MTPKDCPDCDGVGVTGHYLDYNGEAQESDCQNCHGTGSIEGIEDEPEFSA